MLSVENDRSRLILADCLDALREMPDCSIDSIVTDPPYGLSFMGKRWDYDVPSVEIWAECLRVLKPGGNAILQTPFSNALEKGIEDPGIQTELARLHAYGQEDHVRIYGRDWIERFEAPGLRANIRSHAELLGDVDPVVHGVNQSEPFMWFIRT